MEKYFLKEDIKVFCVAAMSFPMGIKKAHEELHALLPAVEGRNFYGISYPGGSGNIIYKAAVEELYEGEGAILGCENFTIRKGEYISETVINWRKDEMMIARIFQTLLAYPGLDKNGYCLEVYFNENDMRCMVTLE